uniref:Cytochrome c domain-containing protein n=1 Tax=Steinernema glaseri TaxID=37863 RepID=A0A1I8AD47_9BILA
MTKGSEKMPEGDYEKGKKIFKQRCAQCHVIDSLATKTGPTLNGVVGRKSGSIADFPYSAANKNKKADERADLIKYIEVEAKKAPSS